MSKVLDKIGDFGDWFDRHSILILGSMATLELLYLVEKRLKGY